MYRIGDYYEVWWTTGKVNEHGRHMARILDIKPYTGKFKDLFNVLLTLDCPANKSRQCNMSALDK